MRPLLLYLLLISADATKAQTIVSGTVINEYNSPISFTNIVSVSRNIGSVSDSSGNFQITAHITDSLKFTSIGYVAAIVAVKDIIASKVIILKEQVAILPPFTVIDISTYNDLAFFGLRRNKANGTFKLSPGSQLAVYITDPLQQIGWIKELHFQIRDVGTCLSKFRLRLLTRSPEGSPGQDLLLENIIVQAIKKGKQKVDISEHRIFMPKEGCFVVIEWLDAPNCTSAKSATIKGMIDVDSEVWFNYRDKAWRRPKLNDPSYRNNTPLISVLVAVKK